MDNNSKTLKSRLFKYMDSFRIKPYPVPRRKATADIIILPKEYFKQYAEDVKELTEIREHNRIAITKQEKATYFCYGLLLMVAPILYVYLFVNH